MSKRVAVLMGGRSAEREISLVTGAACAEGLSAKGYDVSRIDVGASLPALLAALEPRPDAVFNALHGHFGEDGRIQGLLDLMGLPYTHSGLLASALAMDKPVSKRLFAAAGLRCPEGIVVRRDDLAKGDPMARPVVMKPPAEGSSVGVRIMRQGDNIAPQDGWSFGQEVLVERYVPGRELTVAIMDGKALAVTELRPHNGFYDYEHKYTAGRTEHLVPAPVPAEVAKEAERMSVVAHAALGCRGVTRADLRYDDSKPGTTGLYLLEINTQPGMTPLSLVPEQAAYRGISFTDLVAWMVEHARCDA